MQNPGEQIFFVSPTLGAFVMLERARTIQAEEGTVALNRAIWRSFLDPEFDLRRKGRSIQATVLLIFGDRDPAISWKTDGREAAKAIPHAEFVALPCGHAPFAEMPEFFLERGFQFLRHSLPSPIGVFEERVDHC